MAKLDILDNVRVASPCPVQWGEMYGDERRRFCEQCQREVYDLSAMSDEEAREFLVEHEGSACITFFRRADGRVMTRDCLVGLSLRSEKRARRVSRVGVIGIFLMFAAGVFGLFEGLTQTRRFVRPFRVGGFYLGSPGRVGGDFVVALPQVRPHPNVSAVDAIYGKDRPSIEKPTRLLPPNPR